MSAVATKCGTLLDRFAGDLTDAAYPVAVRHGVKGTSVDLEVDVGRAIEDALHRRRREKAAGAGRPVRDDVLAEVTEAVYQVALGRGFSGSFLDMELDLWGTLSRVGRKDP